MMKLSSKRLRKAICFKFGGNVKASDHYKAGASASLVCGGSGGGNINNNEIKWELRPGGMLVQKRSESNSIGELISLKVSTVSECHFISIEATSTFGELKMVLSLVTGLEPREQRILFRGKEREDNEYLHMVGVRNKDKVLLFADPAIKDTKLFQYQLSSFTSTVSHTISV